MPHLLTLFVFAPLALAAPLAFMPRGREGLLKAWALASTLACLALVVPLFALHDASLGGLQLVESVDWIPGWGARYALGLDGVSLLMVALNVFLFPAAVLAGWSSVKDRLKEYLLLLLALECALNGVFLATDALLFYVFWEATLIPMYFLVGVWGGERRIYATTKFVLYTLAGSVLMLAAILVMAQLAAKAGRPGFDMASWRGVAPSGGLQMLLYLAFFAAFAVKVPVFPLHTWLPDAHVEAPTAGSVLLAGVLLKMGGYGLWRFNQPLFPEAALAFQPWLIGLGLAGALYGAAMVLVQTDFKRMVAYSSVSHMGMCVLGLATYTHEGQAGAILTMVNHGVSTGALFLVVGMFYERVHTRDLALYGGAAAAMPAMAALFTLVALSGMGLPGTNGFASELLVLWGAFRHSPWLALAAGLTLVLSAAYMLRMLQKVLLGPVGPAMDRLTDLNLREKALLGVFAAVILAVGVFPAPVLKIMDSTIQSGLAGLIR